MKRVQLYVGYTLHAAMAVVVLLAFLIFSPLFVVACVGDWLADAWRMADDRLTGSHER